MRVCHDITVGVIDGDIVTHHTSYSHIHWNLGLTFSCVTGLALCPQQLASTEETIDGQVTGNLGEVLIR